MTSTETPAHVDAATRWLASLAEPTRAIEILSTASAVAAAELNVTHMSEDGVSTGGGTSLTIAPGNGYQYAIVLTRLAEHAELALGGNLLVSLPEFHVCTLLNDHGGLFHFPDYLDEKMRLGEQHSAILAAFLTLLSFHRASL